jgi:hypothetical protein
LLQGFFLLGNFLLTHFLIYSDIVYHTSILVIVNTLFLIVSIVFFSVMCKFPGYIKKDPNLDFQKLIEKANDEAKE